MSRGLKHGATVFCFPSRTTQGVEPSLRHSNDSRRFPLPIENGLVRPIGANVEREWSVRRWQPVAFLVLPGRFGARIERQRPVCVVREGLVLRAQRVTV